MGKRFDMTQDGKKISLFISNGVEPTKVRTIGGLIEFLQKFPSNWAISLDSGRQFFYIRDDAIASVLTSCGPEEEY